MTTNVAAITAHRAVSASDAAVSRSLERLSSGFRINRAADDAAGLAISEGLRSQIGGMKQALRNTRDGISVVQTAEGALAESASILQRMRDLTVQAANRGALDADAGSALQTEIRQLGRELTRIADTTTFNGTRLLDGTYRGTFQVGADAGDTLTVQVATPMGAAGLGLDGLAVTPTVDPEATTQAARGPQPSLDRGRIAFVGAAVTPSGIASLTGTITVGGQTLDLATVDLTGASSVPAMVARLNAAAAGASGFAYDVDLFQFDAEDLIFRGPEPTSGASSADLTAMSPYYAAASGTATPPMVSTTATTTRPPSAGMLSFPGRGAADIPVLRGTVTVGDHSLDLGTVSYTDTNGDGTVDGDEALAQLNAAAAVAGLPGGFTDVPMVVLGDDVFEPQAAMLRFTGSVPATTATTDDLAALSPQFGHLPDPISAIDAAIRAVSGQRAELGAVQNRFEHTIGRLSTSIENATASESRIRDTDMAAEMVQFTRNQVLTQAGTAMLAQANQSAQGLLTLLQG